MMSAGRRSLCPWTIAFILALVIVGIEIFLIACFYHNLAILDQINFIAFYGFAMFSIVFFTMGAMSAIGHRLFAETRQSLGIAIGVGVAGLLLLLPRLLLCLRLAATGINEDNVDKLTGFFSTLGLSGLTASAIGALVLGGIAYLMTKLTRRRIPLVWVAGCLSVLISIILFSFKSDEYESVSAINNHVVPLANSPLNYKYTNVLIISIDTLRADHIRGYGYPRDTARSIDMLANQGIRFEQAITQKTNTSPAMATLLTGTYPPTHKVLDNHQCLQDFNLLISEMLAAKGYYTCAVVDNPNLTREFNFDQGFAELHYKPKQYEITDKAPYKSQRINQRALAILETVQYKRFFLWLHYVDPHGPYLVPPDYKDLFTGDRLAKMHGEREIALGNSTFGNMLPNWVVYGSQELDFLVAQYDAEIRFVDDSISVIFDALTRLKLWDNTLVIVTADHGESMWEHDYYFNHGDTVYEPTAHVPLIFYNPKLPLGLKVSSPVSLVDLVPTVLDLLQLPIPQQVQGESFAQMLLQKEQAAYRPYHFIMGSHRFGYLTHGVRTNTHKLIYDVDERWLPMDATIELAGKIWVPEDVFNIYRFRNINVELYDLTEDPDETRNIAGSSPDIEDTLADILWEWIESTYAAGRDRESVDPDISDETLNELRALGYF
ncbi:sulfatase [Acidobacteriota bacterium]